MGTWISWEPTVRSPVRTSPGPTTTAPAPFTIRGITNTPIGGDFLQGVSVDQVFAGGEEEVVLSWHNGASGTSMFTVPSDPTDATWPLSSISATTNQEQVPTGDLDGDGDTDIHLGSDWLRQESNGTFSTQDGVTVSGGVPDRVVLADIDGEGDLDVVIGVEFGQRLVWGESSDTVRPGPSTSSPPTWTTSASTRRTSTEMATSTWSAAPTRATVRSSSTRTMAMGASWITHTVDAGDSTLIDHHDGTQLVDMDLDGDLDIISIGWSKKSLTIYENLAIGGGNIDLTPPVITSVIALGDPTQVGRRLQRSPGPRHRRERSQLRDLGGYRRHERRSRPCRPDRDPHDFPARGRHSPTS